MSDDLVSTETSRTKAPQHQDPGACLPRLDELIEGVLATLRPLEVSAFERLECALEDTPWADTEIETTEGQDPSMSQAELDQTAHNLVIRHRCLRKKKPPHRGGAMADIVKGLQSEYPGLPLHMIEVAVCEAACRGAITVRRGEKDGRVAVTDSDELADLIIRGESRPPLDLVFRVASEPESRGSQNSRTASPADVSVSEVSTEVEAGSRKVKRKRRRGQNRSPERLKQDRRIVRAWESRAYATYDALAAELGCKRADIRKALDCARH